MYAFTLTYAPLPFYPVRSVSDLRHLCTQQLNHTPNVHSFLLNVALTQGHTHRLLSPEATVSDLISFIRYKVRVLCLSLFDQVVFVDFLGLWAGRAWFPHGKSHIPMGHVRVATLFYAGAPVQQKTILIFSLSSLKGQK